MSLTYATDFSSEVVNLTSAFIRECCVLGPVMYVEYNVLMCSLAYYTARHASKLRHGADVNSQSSGSQFASAAELRALIQYRAAARRQVP